MIDYIATFIFFFAVIDPIGTVPVFIAVTSKFSAKIKRKIAIQAAMVSSFILIFFIVVGELILNAIEVPLASFQIAGGIVLFLFALTMIFGDSKPDEELKTINASSETAIFPLAVPSIASPGAMLASVMMTENSRYTFIQQVQTTGMMLSVMLIVLILMLASSFIHKYIGNSGASIISRVMGLILSSVAINNVLEGIKIYFSI
jgi:multiple antibiotic resistance protein